MQKICIYQKKAVPLRQIKKNQCLTIKIHTIMKLKKGQIAWLSARTQRVFANFEEALKDAEDYIYITTDIRDKKKAYDDVYLVHLWLEK